MRRIFNGLNKKTKIYFIAIIFISIFIFSAKNIFAITNEIPITLEFPIPGMEDGVTDFSNYLILLYNYFIYISGILAVIMIMIAGFQWVTAGGNQTKIGEAKTRIVSALTGLFLVFGSYLILNTINPELTILKMPHVQEIKTIDLGGSRDSCLSAGGTIVSEATNCRCNAGITGTTQKISTTSTFSSYCCYCPNCPIGYNFVEDGDCNKNCLVDKKCTGYSPMNADTKHGKQCCMCSGCPEGTNLLPPDSQCANVTEWTTCTIPISGGNAFGYCDNNKHCIKCIEDRATCSDNRQCVAHNTGRCGINVPTQVSCDNGKCQQHWYGQ